MSVGIVYVRDEWCGCESTSMDERDEEGKKKFGRIYRTSESGGRIRSSRVRPGQ